MKIDGIELGKREAEVVHLLMQGKSNNQIAYQLGISVRTVEYHLGKVYAKLEVASRSEAILKLSRAGLWESTVPKDEVLGESRVENGSKIGDDDVNTFSPRRIPMQHSAHMGRFAQPWAAISLVLLLTGFGLLLIGLVLSALGMIWLPTRSEVVGVSTTPPAVWGIDVAQGADLGLPRTWHTATRLEDGRILLVGGGNGVDDQYALAEIYDPVSGLFTPTTPLHTPRHEHSATLLLDGRVLVVGGYNAQQRWLKDAEVYDPRADTWTVSAPLYLHGVQHTATRLADGRVLVVGGCIASGVCTGQAEIFDPQSHTWTEVTSPGASAASHTAILLEDGRVLAAGGTLDGSGAQLYDPQANTWTATGAMFSQHAQAAMLKLVDGRALLAGGINLSDHPNVLSSTEIFDPGTNTWTVASSLAQPRFGHLLALLPDGQVLAVGGARVYDYPDDPWRAESFAQLIERYDPAADRWVIAGELPLPMIYAAVVNLPGSRLWVTGGGAGSASAKAWAKTWLITPLYSQP